MVTIRQTTIATLSIALSAGSCGGGSSNDGTGGGGSDGGADGTTSPACSADADCASQVPPTAPANCAKATCSVLEGVCVFSAKDADGDGHAAANCKSTTAVPVQVGDDCNDNDPTLYPGHPKSCTPGGADAGYCPTGQLTCLADGTESACSTMCKPCNPNTLGCDGAQPQQCNASGTGSLPTGASCATTIATPACLNGACVACAPDTLRCDPLQPQQPDKCDASGAWQANGGACVANETCVSGACVGLCGPGQTRCNPTAMQQPQTCDAMGIWQNSGSACPVNETCVTGACAGVCGPGQTECIGNTPQSCGTAGQWQAGTPCSGAMPACAAGSCHPPPLSCAPGGAGMTNCGTGSESCCTSLEVAGGSYARTYTNSGSGPTGTADPATVSGFRLDKYEVTVGRFRQFVNAWNGTPRYYPAQGSGKHVHLNGGRGLSGGSGTYEPGWTTASYNAGVMPTSANLACDAAYATWTAAIGSNEKLPVNCVRWEESYAFCIWDGAFLPSEAEWEYAAAAGSQERQYPWGSTAPSTNNQYAIYACHYPAGTVNCTGVNNIAPVGTPTLGAGLWGQLDLAGNVYEWNLDSYTAAYQNPCTDCANFAPNFSLFAGVIRGGWYQSSATPMQPWIRPGSGSARDPHVGFRCARTP